MPDVNLSAVLYKTGDLRLVIKNLTARPHGRPHTLIAVDARVFMIARLCASTTTHAANVRFWKFLKMPSFLFLFLRNIR